MMRALAWDRDRADDEKYRDGILGAMRLHGYTQETLAKALNMSRNTLRSRLRDTQTITRGEDRALRRLLNMDSSHWTDWRDLT